MCAFVDDSDVLPRESILVNDGSCQNWELKPNDVKYQCSGMRCVVTAKNWHAHKKVFQCNFPPEFIGASLKWTLGWQCDTCNM